MQSEAVKLTGFAAVISALGFLIRWLQGIQIIDPDTGLAARGMGISVVMTLLILLTAAALAAMVYRLSRDFTLPTAPEEALAGRDSLLYRAVFALGAVLLALAGVVLLVHTPENAIAGQAAANRVCGLGALAGAAGVVLVTNDAAKPEKAFSRRLGSGLLILFGGLWLITAYKTAATDPVIWRYAVEILGICAALLAFYYLAGYQFEEPKPKPAVFFCYLGAFFCVMSAVDEHTFAESVLYGAAALLLFAWGHTLVLNLRPGALDDVDSKKAEA